MRARTNAHFLLDEMRRDDGRLLRSWQDGRANLLAYAEDYGALLGALLTLAELDDVQWLAEARAVADGLVALFADDERGGFFTTGDDADALIVRPKDFQDNATPSENSLAADGLLRLSALTGDPDGAQRAERWLATLAPVLGEHPTAFAYLLEALEHRGAAVARTGDRGRRRSRARRARRRRAHPGAPGFGAGDRAPGRAGPSSPRCWPIARSSTVGPRPTCANTSRVSCRSPTPTRSAPSSTGASTPNAEPEHDASTTTRTTPAPIARSRASSPASSSVTAAAAAAFAGVGRVTLEDVVDVVLVVDAVLVVGVSEVT